MRWATACAAWRRVVAGAAQNGIPTPAFSSSLAYYDGIRAERLPAALIQAQRDFFGAHTYRRVDKDGSFHTEWSGDRTETEVGAAFKPRGDRAQGGREGRHSAAVTVRAVIGWAEWPPRAAVRNQLARPGFADRAGANGMVPNGGDRGVLRDRPGEPLPVRAVAAAAGAAGRATGRCS